MNKHNYTIDQLREAVKNSYSIAECLRYLGIEVHRNMYKTITSRIKQNSIDTTHFNGQSATKKKGHAIPLNDILSNKVHYSSSTNLKKRLIESGLLEYKCYGESCGISTWYNNPITLQLEHRDGDHYNNNLDNLCLLCPNCHSQTKTYAGKNCSKLIEVEYSCLGCNIGFKSKYYRKYCSSMCSRKHTLTHKSEPKFVVSKDELEDLVWSMPIKDIAKIFNVTDSSIHKKCRSFNVKKPPRGYWLKQKPLD